MNPIIVKLDQTEAYKCKCGSELFQLMFFIRVIPAVISPTMKKEKQPMQVYQCVRCKTIVNFTDPDPISEKKSQ